VVNYKPAWNLDESLESNALTNVAAYAQYIKHATQQMVIKSKSRLHNKNTVGNFSLNGKWEKEI
jgi:hypothetical protein